MAALGIAGAVPARTRVAGWSLLASVPVSGVGVAALIGMYAGFALGARTAALTLGQTNDVLGLVGAALMAPAVVEIHALTGPGRREARAVLAIVGLGGFAAVVWLQFLLVTGRIPFEQQIGPVMVAYLVLAIWFVGSGWTAQRAGAMPRGARLGVLGASYVGAPWWAWRWGRVLLALAERPSAAEDLRPTPAREAAP